MKKLITGIKPTGESLHLGNLMGAILPMKKMLVGNDAAVFIADLHALTSVHDGELLRQQTLEIAIQYLSIFGEDTAITLFRQSDIHDITKLMWILANITPYSLMLRAHSFKDSEAKSSDLNMGVFNYPILMAADIIGYDIDAVPVGKDQIQHLEMTRDIARNFNKIYKTNLFKEPEALVSEDFGILPGLDGRKMSKSYNNFIGVFDDAKTLRKKVMSIVTDSKGVNDIKDPESCTIVALVRALGSADEVGFLMDKYRTPNSGFGYGHAKEYLFDILDRFIAPYRERRERLLGYRDRIEESFRIGAEVMIARLKSVMDQVSRITGVK